MPKRNTSCSTDIIPSISFESDIRLNNKKQCKNTYSNIGCHCKVNKKKPAKLNDATRSSLARMSCGTFPLESELGRYNGFPSNRHYLKFVMTMFSLRTKNIF